MSEQNHNQFPRLILDAISSYFIYMHRHFPFKTISGSPCNDLNHQQSQSAGFNSTKSTSGKYNQRAKTTPATHNTYEFCHRRTNLTHTHKNTLNQMAPTNRALDWMKVDREGRGFWVM